MFVELDGDGGCCGAEVFCDCVDFGVLEEFAEGFLDELGGQILVDVKCVGYVPGIVFDGALLGFGFGLNIERVCWQNFLEKDEKLDTFTDVAYILFAEFEFAEFSFGISHHLLYII